MALVLLVAGAVIVAVPTPTPVSAAVVNIGTVQAQMASHRGQDNGTSGNCITYAPPLNPPTPAVSTTLVTTPNEAVTAHGYRDSCPSTLSTANQSAVGFRPSSVTSITDGTTFPIGRMIHYNNPIQASDRYFTGTLNTVLTGFTAPNTLSFNWRLDETPNSPSAVNDEITFTNQVSNVTLTQGGLTFRLVLLGFVPTTVGTTPCPATPTGPPVNEFSTVEGGQTHACLYASVVQVRSLTIVKTVVGTSPPARTFSYTSTSALAGSPWSNGVFNLAAGAQETRAVTSGNTVTVTETDPGDDRWTVTGLTCTQTGLDGQPEVVPGATLNLAARQVVLSNIPPPPLASAPGITCTYTNSYTPRSTLTLVKQVTSGTAAPALWTLTATGSAAPPPAGAVVSGPSGSPAVTGQRVPAGTYALSETGTGAAATGYVQVGSWACRTAGGATVPVTGSNVTLPDVAAGAGAGITCTVANRLATGSLQISKVVDAPPGAYTGGPTKTFAGTYNCGPDASGTFSTLTTATPVTISGIPAGRTCLVTETPPTGGLANASYAWGTATYSTQPVTITDQGTAAVTITNPVVQTFGTFSVTKTVRNTDPDAGGYVGGTDRVFPLTYSCTLTNGPTTAGDLDLTLGRAASPPAPIPTGSVCTFAETLVADPGDFADASYVWSGSVVTPSSVTIGVDTTVTLGVTNTYTRRFGSLQVAKVVSGEGYIGGTTPAFTIAYDCGTGFSGTVTIAAGGSATVPGLPAGALCAVQEEPPAPDLLDPAFTWGSPTWAPAALVTIAADEVRAVTVTNPTIPIFGQVRVTKQISGETSGVTAGATFLVRIDCPGVDTFELELGVGVTGSTPDLPVGTTCTITEDAPDGGLIDASFAWGDTFGEQEVTITASGQVVAVTVTNDVVRVVGSLSITKAPITPAGVVDPGRTFAVDYRCVYGNDAPVTGTVTLTAGGAAATIPGLLVGSQCAVTERTDALSALPNADDPSWVWLPVSYLPSEQAVIGTTPVSVSVVNSIRQLTGSFNVTKAVVGAGKEGGYTPGDGFGFDVVCGGGPTLGFVLADGTSFEGERQPVLTTCTVTETSVPPTTPSYGWDPPEFTVDGVPSGSGSAVTFQLPASGAPVQINVVNPITPRVGAVTVTKEVSGAVAGLAPDAPPFIVNLTCGPGLTYQLDVPADGAVTQGGIPIGSVCTASESSPSSDGLVDASFAWGAPSYDPDPPTVTVTADGVTVAVINPILRVTAPVRLVKTFTGPQGVIDAARTYPVTWSCTYRGTAVAGGTVDVTADPAGVTLADDVPVTSVCTATEGDLGPPSVDPAFRWLAPTITGTTIEAPGPNTVTVANVLTRDSGIVRVHKVVTGAVGGYTGGAGGPTGANFTLHGQCSVPDQPQIPTRTADGSIADGGFVDVVASIGWTCSGYEDTPSQDLLLDDSYAWGPAVLDPAGPFVLTRDEPLQVFEAENPIVRVTSTFSIVKAVTDPFGVVDPGTTFTGTYTCQYRDDVPVTGPWTITPGSDATFVVPDLLLGSVCAVTEADPGTAGLPDGSFAWAPSVIGAPVSVEAGGTSAVTVTNTVVRRWAGLQVTKTVVDPDGGVVPGTQFGGVWECVQGRDTYSDRFTVAADGTTTLFTPTDARVPATSVCTITEDTLDSTGLRDASFAWSDPTYAPADVRLVAGETASLGVTNTVARVYSDVTIRKFVTGPGAPQVPTDRPFTGLISCQYGTDTPIETTWSATTATPALRAGVLVGSVCSVVEDDPGEGGQPVTGDSSYVWEDPVVSAPVTVTPPEELTPPIDVTNPTDRLFGTFDVNKFATGAVEGIADPATPFTMLYECLPGTGDPIAGVLEVPLGVPRSVGPELEIPTGSECTLTEPADTLPDLVDDAWSWGDPAFAVDGAPVDTTGRTLQFDIPTPQEDRPEPNVQIVVANPVERAFGAFSIAKSSDPPPGSVLQPGSVITYSLRVSSTGAVPVHDIVLTDDLAGVLPVAFLVPGSITAPAGTTAALDEAAEQLVWTVGTVPAGTTLLLTYQVQISPGAVGATLTNSVTATGDVPVDPCTECEVGAETGAAPEITKDLVGTPTLDPATGNWVVSYRIVVTNPDAVNAAPYALNDELGFPAGVEVRSAAVTSSPPGVTRADPAWNGTTATLIAGGATLPAAGTHAYEVTVSVFVPTTVSAAALQCTLPQETAGAGLFNAARVTSLGLGTVDTACGSVPVPVPAAADLRLSKVVDRATVVVDRDSAVRARLVYTIVVTNDGPAPAVGTVITDTLPGGVIPISSVPSVGTCTRDGARLTCPVGTIAAGATVRVVVTIELPVTYPATTVTNSAQVASSTPDPNVANNAATVVTRVTIRAGGIPITGAQIAGALGIGGGLFGAGIALIGLTRRRRRTTVPV